MRARYHDGLTTRTHAVEVQVADGALAFEAEGEARRWPLDAVEAERVGQEVRLSWPGAGAARLMVAASDWRAAAGEDVRRTGLRREARLVLALLAGALVLGLAIFVGIPLAAGPLAKVTPPAFEEGVGHSFEAQLTLLFKPCAGEAGQQALASLGERLEAAADTPFDIRAQAVEAPMINAFALPGGAVLVTDDLIEAARSPDELAAVLAHEAAHVERRHVMQAVWRSLGLGLVLDAVVGGGTGAGQQLVLMAGSVTELRYSRDAELEADARGQQLLRAAGVSSEGMAPFFQRLAAKGEGAEAAMVKELISTHPNSGERAKLSQARGRPGPPAMSEAEWGAVKAACAGPPRRD